MLWNSTMKTVVILAFVALALACAHADVVCTPEYARQHSIHTMEEALANPHVHMVIYGRVTAHYHMVHLDHSHGTDAQEHHEETYTAQVEVFCHFKEHEDGHSDSEDSAAGAVLNITNAGFIHTDDACEMHHLEKGKRYILFLKHVHHPSHEVLPLHHVEVTSGDREISKLMTFCGISPHYPIGVTPSTAEVQCPAKMSTTQCTHATAPTTTDLVTHSHEQDASGGGAPMVTSSSVAMTTLAPLLIARLL